MAAKEARFSIERRAHSQDSNRDELSDLETVSLHIQDVSAIDQGFYVCLVANSASAFRATHAFLKVISIVTTNEFHWFDSIIDQKWTICAAIACILFIVTLLFFACRSSDLKVNKLLQESKAETPNFDQLIERTMSSMKKVSKIYIKMGLFFNHFPFFINRTLLMFQ